MGPENQAPVVLRDAFYRLTKDHQTGFQIVLAEQAKPLTSDAGYDDLLSFESDIAQVVGLILLFAESAGSLAELGAFAAMPTVSPSLLAVVDDHYYQQGSFIKNGPIKYLEKKHGDEWVVSLERSIIGIDAQGKIGGLNEREFLRTLEPAIKKRLAGEVIRSKFDPNASGHLILLLVGLCQECGALTISEIRECFEILGAKPARMNNLIYCAELLGWLKTVRKGNNIFYVGVPEDLAIEFQLTGGNIEKDGVRRRLLMREYWKENDPSRFRAITETILARGAGR